MLLRPYLTIGPMVRDRSSATTTTTTTMTMGIRCACIAAVDVEKIERWVRAVKGAEVGVDPEEEPPTPPFDFGRPPADRPCSIVADDSVNQWRPAIRKDASRNSEVGG